MNCLRFAVASAFVALMALGLPAAAWADAPFSADLFGLHTDFTPHNVGIIEGVASHMGDVTGEFADKFTKNGNHVEALTILRAANGDTIMFSSEVDRVAPRIWVGTFLIVGGTGRFAGVSGGGVMIVDNRDPGFGVTLDGTLSD